MKKKVVLAYSGGLDTSVVLKWIQEKYDSDVVTVTLDIGQLDDLKGIDEKSRNAGSVSHYTIDAKKEFVNDFIFPSIKANGLYQGKYPLGTALGRPLIAAKLVEVAKKEGCYAVAHGCTGKGNDQIRLDVTIQALNPSLKIIAPVREFNLTRDQEVDYAKLHNISISQKKSVYSIDQNLWGRAIEAGPLEDPYAEPLDDVLEWCKPVNDTPNKPEYIELEFQKGVPIAVDGKEMGGVELIDYVNRIAGSHGVGVIDHIEDRLVGIKSREVYEAPAAVTIIESHNDLEKLVLTRNQIEFKTIVEQRWAWLVYSGLWVDPLRVDLDRFIDSTQKKVNGKVKVKFFKGHVKVVGRSSPYSLYDSGLATYTSSSTFDQKAATGFSDLWGLSSRVAHNIDPKYNESV
ncbi:argininosuccinate synthase [Thermoproteota archaeon]